MNENEIKNRKNQKVDEIFRQEDAKNVKEELEEIQKEKQ